MNNNKGLKILSLVVMLCAGAVVVWGEVPTLLAKKLWQEQPLSEVSSIGSLIILGGIIYIMFRRVIRAYSNKPSIQGNKNIKIFFIKQKPESGEIETKIISKGE